MSVGMEHAMKEGRVLSTRRAQDSAMQPVERRDSRVCKGFVCHAQLTGSSCADRGERTPKEYRM